MVNSTRYETICAFKTNDDINIIQFFPVLVQVNQFEWFFFWYTFCLHASQKGSYPLSLYQSFAKSKKQNVRPKQLKCIRTGATLKKPTADKSKCHCRYGRQITRQKKRWLYISKAQPIRLIYVWMMIKLEMCVDKSPSFSNKWISSRFTFSRQKNCNSREFHWWRKLIHH